LQTLLGKISSKLGKQIGGSTECEAVVNVSYI